MTKKSEQSDKLKDKAMKAEEKSEQEQVQEEAQKEEATEDNEEKKAPEEKKATEEQEKAAEEENRSEAELGEAEGRAKKEPTAEEKLAELQDRYLRLTAEYDNFRKRTLREKIDLQRNANENLLNALLPVADDFDRALQLVNDAKDIEAVKEGLKLISGKFNGFLGQQGVKEIEAAKKMFDTDLHEAITKIPAPSKKMKGKVVDVVQKGYYLNEKVLRFAKGVIGE